MEGKKFEIDALKDSLKNAKDADIPSIYNKLSLAYLETNYDSVRGYLIKTIESAQKFGDPASEAIATKNLGLNYAAEGEITEAIELQRKAREIANSIKDHDTELRCINNLGYLYHTSLQIEIGLQVLFEGLELCDEYNYENDMTKALILGNIASCYTAMNEDSQAMKYLNEIMTFSDRLDMFNLKVRFCDELALSMNNNGLLEEAISYCNQCIKWCQESNYKSAEVNALLVMSQILYDKGDLQNALSYVIKGEALNKKLGFSWKAPDIRLLRSKILKDQDNIDASIEMALAAYKDPDALRAAQAASITDQLRKLYKIKGDYSEAYRFQELQLKWSKADQEEKAKYLAAELNAKYQNENHLKNIELLNKEKDLNNQRSKLYQFGLFFLSVALISGFFLFIQNSKSFRKLGKVNKELTKTKQELEANHNDLKKYIESNIQLEQFAHVASHDLRAPIITIKSFSELLSKKSRDKLESEELSYLNFIEKNAVQLLDLVTDLLEYSKVNSEELNIGTVNTKNIITDICDILNNTIDKTKSKITNKGTFNSINADELKLKRVIQNLITNAIKFSDKDRINEISISQEETEEAWKFIIEDKGIGIEETNIDIFQPYKQLNRKQDFKGTGMGLSICRRIVEQHGGHIDYYSTPGSGSTFYFTISKFLNPFKL